MEQLEDISPRVQLRDNNAAFVDAYHEIYAPKVHVGRPANLGHGPMERLPAFYMQLESPDVLALSVPPATEKLLVQKYKLNNGGQPVKPKLYLGQFCENKV